MRYLISQSVLCLDWEELACCYLRIFWIWDLDVTDVESRILWLCPPFALSSDFD